MKTDVVITIPYYNHPDTLREVVCGCLAVHPHVWVVDDGSRVAAHTLLSDLDVRIITHEKNMGKGQAVLTAGQEAKDRGFTHIITIDADGQHDPADINKFLAAIEESPSSLFVGKRDFCGSGAPDSSVFGRSFSNFWFRLQTGYSLGDCQSGFRSYPIKALTEIRYLFRGYAFEVEVLVKSAWAGFRCRDVDISVFYPEGDKRISHFHKLRDNFRLTLLNSLLTSRVILPWPHRKLVEASGEDKAVKVSLLHPIRSIRELVRRDATPVQLAAGAAIGMTLGVLPLLFCHTVAILLVTNYFRANKVIGVAISQLCAPPVMPALCIEVGYYLQHGRFLTEFTLETLGYQCLDRIWDWFMGSLLIAPVTGLLAGMAVYLVARSSQTIINDKRARKQIN